MSMVFNPIIREEKFSNGFFTMVPNPQAGTAIILSVKEKTDGMRVIDWNNRITPKEVKKGKYDWLVEVDVMPHAMEIEMQTMSANHIYSFKIKLRVRVTVIDPKRIYLSGIRDMENAVRNSLEGVIDECSEECEIHEIKRLKEKIRENFSVAYDMEEGFRVEVQNIIVDMDEQVKAQLREKEDLVVKKQLREKEVEMANELYNKYGPETGMFINIIKGEKNPEEIEKYRRTERAEEFNTQINMAERTMELFQKMQDSGMISENDMQKITRGMASELTQKVTQSEIGIEQKYDRLLEGGEDKKYASFDEEE